jgi:tetratricopeptide (TPR) repeat protein
MEEAKRYFDDAMTLLDTLPETEGNQRRRIALLANQGGVMVLLFKFPEYYDLLTRYEAVAVRVGDPGLLGAIYARMGWGEWTFGYFDQAIQTLTKAADLCDVAGNAEDAGQAYMLLQWSHLLKGDYDQVLTLKAQVLRVMEQRFNLRWYAWALKAASLAYAWLGRWDDAVDEGQKGLRVSEEFSDHSEISIAAWTLSMVYTSKGDLVRALEYGELGVRKAPTPADKAWSQGFLAWVWCRAGEPHRGVEVLAQVVSIQRAARFIWSEVFALFLGEGYWLAGEYDQARQTLEDLLDVAEHRGMKFLLGAAHRLLGEVAMSPNPTQSEAPFAVPHFEQSIAILQQIKAENELALAYAGYGRLHRQQGHVEQAREYLTRALAIFERLGTLGEPDKVRQTLAILPQG